MEAVLNESFKAFVRESFPQNSESVVKIFEEVINDRVTTQKIGLEDLKIKAIHEIRAEFVTKDFLKAEIAEVRQEISEVKAELKAEIAEVRQEVTQVKAELKAEIAEVKVDILKWVLGMQVATITIILAGMKFLLS